MQAQFRRAILGLAVIALAVAAPVRAQDVDPTGTWDLAFSTQQGPIGAQMIINRQPTGYTGTITSDLGQAQLEAAVKGSAVTVGFTMTMSGGDSLGVTMNGTGVMGAHVIAYDPAAGTLVGGFSLGQDGSFVIAGLDPGPHVLRVEPLDDADLDSFFDETVHVDVDFRPTFFDKLVVVPRGGTAKSVELKVASK